MELEFIFEYVTPVVEFFFHQKAIFNVNRLVL